MLISSNYDKLVASGSLACSNPSVLLMGRFQSLGFFETLLLCVLSRRCAEQLSDTQRKEVLRWLREIHDEHDFDNFLSYRYSWALAMALFGEASDIENLENMEEEMEEHQRELLPSMPDAEEEQLRELMASMSVQGFESSECIRFFQAVFDRGAYRRQELCYFILAVVRQQ